MSNFASVHMSSKKTAASLVFFALGALLVIVGLTVSAAIPSFPASVIGMTAVMIGVALAASLYAAAMYQELNR